MTDSLHIAQSDGAIPWGSARLVGFSILGKIRQFFLQNLAFFLHIGLYLRCGLAQSHDIASTD